MKYSSAIAASALVLTFAMGVTACTTDLAQAGDQASTSGKPAIGTWGFDGDGMDLSINPGDDFAKYAGGTWQRKNEIPADRTRWGAFDILRAKSEEDQKTVIQEAAARPQTAGTSDQKVADMYNSYMDIETIEKLGLKPVEADLKQIANARTHEDIARLMSEPDLFLASPFGLGKGLDEKNPDRYSIDIGQSGLGMPTRDYYLSPDQKFVDLRTKYVEFLEKMLALADYAGAKGAASNIMSLETKIAEIHWPIEKRRNRDLTYNLKTKAELKAFAPEIPWDVVLTTLNIPNHDVFVVAETDAVQGLAKLFKATPVDVWKKYLTARYLSAWSDILPKKFDDANFDFYGKTLNGQPQQRDRWRRAVGAVNGSVGELVGQLYVAKYFPADSKAKMIQLVEGLKGAYRQQIKALKWMSAETKVVALRKVDTLRTKIGFPDKWRDYSALDIKPGDAVGNRKRFARFDWAYDVETLSKPTDRDQWFMTPQTVNAYYNPTFNEIVFPAAILQAPFFDPNADMAVNFGGIGGVIGHEIGHGFDDQGAKSDENGVLHTWWNDKDVEQFKGLTTRLSKQYSGYTPLPGLNINGDLTLGENIGDLGGLGISYVAYKAATKGQSVPKLDGFTGDQRFFLGWAQVWRQNIREEALRNQIKSDPHSPAQYRINGVVPNIDAWYNAFGIKSGALYVKPEDRIVIWQ